MKQTLVTTAPQKTPVYQSVYASNPLQLLSPVVQRGGVKWTPHHNREKIEELASGGGNAAFYTKDDNTFYVEAWKKEDNRSVYTGHIQIQRQGDYIILHTRSEPGYDGGLSSILMGLAMKKIAKEFSGYKTVQMTPAPGAASKKTIEMLSSAFGDQDLHQQAESLRQQRKKSPGIPPPKEETEEERDKRLQTFDPAMMEEHLFHLRALAESNNTQGMKLLGTAGFIAGAENEEPVETPEDRVRDITTRDNIGGYGITLTMAKFKLLAASL